MGTVREEVEGEIRRLSDRADWQGAVTVALDGYGPEVLGFLYAALDDVDDARDAFSIFSEALWRGLPEFRWQCLFRTWAYTLARSAIGRVLRDPRRLDRFDRLSQTPEVALRVDAIRTATKPYLRTEVKARVRSLRESLEPDDQLLLQLRIDRSMPWRDVAIVMLGADASEEALGRETALLRKRFERIKQRIRALAPPS